MKTWLSKINIELGLYFLAVALGGLVRFSLLGHTAPGDGEARLALQAMDLMRAGGGVSAPEPGYILLTSLTMFLFGATNFAARLWPALAGTVLIAAAWLIRDPIGRKPALMLAFLLALDPVLVAASRTATGSMPAVTCMVLGGILLLRGKSAWAGAFLGLGLLAGPAVWPGVISLGLVYWLFHDRLNGLFASAETLNVKLLAFTGLSVFGVVGSLLLFAPTGISAAAASLVAYLRGWAGPSVTTISHLFGVLLAYQLPAFLLGLAGLAHGLRHKDPVDTLVSVWWGLALVLALANPARTTLDVAWPAIPMLILAARQIGRLKVPEKADRLPVLGQAALTIVLLLFFFYTLLFNPITAGASYPIEALIRLGMAIVLLVAVTGMVAWGWSQRVAVSGLQYGVGLLLGILSFSALFHATGYSRNPAAELISPSPFVASADLLQLTLKETIMTRPNPTTEPSIAVVNYPSDALRWALRDYPQVVFTSLPISGLQPDIVISEQTSTPELAAEYRGQALTWTKSPAWSLLAPYEWLRWWMYRDVPLEGMENHQIIYWMKSDEFPGGAAVNKPIPSPADSNPNGQDPNIQ